MTYTVLVTAPTLAAAGLKRLAARNCRVLFIEQGQGAGEIEALMAREPVDAVISRTLDLTSAALQASPRLKVVCKHGVGVGNIDVDAATRLGIPVFVTPGANAQSVAEMTLALMFAAARRVPWMDRQLRQGQWSRVQDGLQLSGRTLGLVGFGQVARRVAAACQAIGMSVVVYDPFLPEGAAPEGVERVERLDQLLPLSNVLSLHVPLTAQTRQLIGAAELAALPADALLINTARGEVVDEAALIAALRERRLFAAGLDTMAVEPLPASSPLLQLDNVVLTPHVGGSTPAALAAMARDAVQHVLAYLDGEPGVAACCVNPLVFNR